MKIRLITAYMLILLISACNNKQTAEEESDNNRVDITKEQFVAENMLAGLPTKVAIEERIHFTGKIAPAINGVVKINAPVEGIVKVIKAQEGESIGANETLCTIGGFVLIELQQQFATSAAKLKQLEANFERAKLLYNDDIKTESEYLLIESDYKSELANYTALKLKLEYIGLDIANIENGKYASEYSIKCPVDGQLSQLNIETGQYVNQENMIAELVNKDKVELQMYFFENDFSKIRKAQKVVFGSIADASYNAKAIVTRTGSKLSDNSNTVTCYASIDKA